MLPPLTARHGSGGETELPSAPLERISPESCRDGQPLGSVCEFCWLLVWDEAGSAEILPCSARNASAKGIWLPSCRDEALPGSASWHGAALPLPLAVPSSGALWQFQAGNIWLCNSPLLYLAVAGSKTPPLAFTTHFHSKGCQCRDDAKGKSSGWMWR